MIALRDLGALSLYLSSLYDLILPAFRLVETTLSTIGYTEEEVPGGFLLASS